MPFSSYPRALTCGILGRRAELEQAVGRKRTSSAPPIRVSIVTGPLTCTAGLRGPFLLFSASSGRPVA